MSFAEKSIVQERSCEKWQGGGGEVSCDVAC